MPPAPANLVVAPFCEERLEQLRRGALVDTAADFGPVMAARAVEDTRCNEYTWGWHQIHKDKEI